MLKRVIVITGVVALLVVGLAPTVSASDTYVSEELIQEKNESQAEDIYQYIDTYINEQNTDKESHISEQELHQKLNSLDIQSLNDVINYSISTHQKEQCAFHSTRSGVGQSALKVAWKGAAAIAR